MVIKITGSRNLIKEVQTLTLVFSTVIILVIQIIFMAIISYSMVENLRQDADRVADEIAVYLSEPMYNIDDQQTIRIAESMLVSGRLSGIFLVTTASGTLVSEMIGPESRYLEPIKQEIYRDSLLLGTVTLFFSDEEILTTRRRFFLIGILIMAAVFTVNVLANRFFLQKRILNALQPIFNGIRKIQAGEYSSTIENSPYTDINILVSLINQMAASILAKNSQLIEANTLLEHRVELRTEELSKSLSELKMAQDHLVESGKLSALGLLAAGMAHELNTPLGAILSSNRTVIDFFDTKMDELRKLYLSMNEREYALYKRLLLLGENVSKNLELQDINRSHQRAIRDKLEKAGIDKARIVTEYLVDLKLNADDVELLELLTEPRAVQVLQAASAVVMTRSMAQIIDVAGKKASAVVSALRFYLSPESENMDAIVDIEQDIEKILTLMNNMLRHGITITRDYSGVRTKGSSERLGQVWMNIIRNAAQAMEFKGELIIKTRNNESNIVVSFIDSGPGIPQDILPYVFNPFLTTKKHGEGMGLGLDICRRIIDAHKGSIEIDTCPGRTEFRIILPSV